MQAYFRMNPVYLKRNANVNERLRNPMLTCCISS